MLIQALTKNERDQGQKIQYTCFQSFQIHPVAIMYDSEHSKDVREHSWVSDGVMCF